MGHRNIASDDPSHTRHWIECAQNNGIGLSTLCGTRRLMKMVFVIRRDSGLDDRAREE
jgi:hypothetical protein